MEAEILQRLRDDEIYYQLTYLGKGTYFIRILDKKGERITVNRSCVADNLKNALTKLASEVTCTFAESEFAKWWKEQQENK